VVIRRFRRPGVMAGVSGVMVAAVVMGLLGADQRPALDQGSGAETVQLPTRFGQTLATRSYLDREGAVLLQLLASTAILPDTRRYEQPG
jgi:hypothetical protein